ncbi:MAG: SUKH-3 domain-containing protein [Chloroflexi bacterium]|nr:SUKH-3 domain-containing protein [Chloroflexota bacterium]
MNQIPEEHDRGAFSDATKHQLRRAGWNPTRSVSTTHVIRSLEAEGFTVFPVVREFLQHFGNLIFKERHGFFHTEITFHFDAQDAADGIFRERVEDYAELLHVPLCPIGRASHATLMMDPNGAIYGGFDDGLLLWGHTPIEAIENLVQARPVQTIHDERSPL